MVKPVEVELWIIPSGGRNKGSRAQIAGRSVIRSTLVIDHHISRSHRSG